VPNLQDEGRTPRHQGQVRTSRSRGPSPAPVTTDRASAGEEQRQPGETHQSRDDDTRLLHIGNNPIFTPTINRGSNGGARTGAEAGGARDRNASTPHDGNARIKDDDTAFTLAAPYCRLPDPNPLTGTMRRNGLEDSVMAAVTTDSATIRRAFIHDSLPQQPHRQDLADSSLHQICVWGSACTTPVMWLRLDMAGRAVALNEGDMKVDRVEQRNDSTRFDVFVLPTVASFWRCRMSKFALWWRWHFQDHIPLPLQGLAADPRIAPPVEVATLPATTACRAPLRPGMLNINGVRTKQTNLWHLLWSECLDVLALQETLLKATDWDLHVPDYLCLSALGTTTASQRGVLLLVSTKFRCQSVGPGSPHWVFGKLAGLPLTGPLIVGSVYLPHNNLQSAPNSPWPW